MEGNGGWPVDIRIMYVDSCEQSFAVYGNWIELLQEAMRLGWSHVRLGARCMVKVSEIRSIWVNDL